MHCDLIGRFNLQSVRLATDSVCEIPIAVEYTQWAIETAILSLPGWKLHARQLQDVILNGEVLPADNTEWRVI